MMYSIWNKKLHNTNSNTSSLHTINHYYLNQEELSSCWGRVRITDWSSVWDSEMLKDIKISDISNMSEIYVIVLEKFSFIIKLLLLEEDSLTGQCNLAKTFVHKTGTHAIFYNIATSINCGCISFSL